MEESRQKLTVSEKQAYVLDTYKNDPLLLYIIDRQAQDIFINYAQAFFENVDIDKHYTNNTATQLLGFNYPQKILNILNDAKYSNYLRPYKKGNQYRHNIETLFKLLLITFLSESLLLNAPDISTILGEDAAYVSFSDDNERANNPNRQNVSPVYVKGMIDEAVKESKQQMQEAFKQFAEEIEKRDHLKDIQYVKLQNSLLEHITFTEKINRKELELIEGRNKINLLQTELSYLDTHIKTEERQLSENKRLISVLVDREQEAAQQATLHQAEEITVNVPIPSGKRYVPRFLKNIFFVEEGEDVSEQSVKITKEKDNENIEQIKQRQATLLSHIEDLTKEQGNITASIENRKQSQIKLKNELQQSIETVRQIEEDLHGLKSNKDIEALKKLIMTSDN